MATKIRINPPRSFVTSKDGTLACKHRGRSCCDECAAANPEIVEVAGAHFWIADPTERAAFMAEEE